ncbi:protein MALE DISCOVERER 2 isoform X3 [Coffea arabica]|uniref:Protein MALE DISCOVERER 2 isoform X3 n=1 Tax=Coffea arabica TaxID=13443 RepID=A0A6P6VSF1_COFAR|nr:protein MALE DISCOVERER 2-like isoform X3 [Coffea arabica]
MVRGAMGGSWTTNYEIKLSRYLLLILVLKIQGCFTLNSEGLTLLEFRGRVTSDPFQTFSNWNPSDKDPCTWSGVHCVDGKVQMLDLNGRSLEGVLAPELGNLTHLRSLVLCENHFSGVIPKQFGWLAALEVLDLRNNNLSGTIPAEIAWLHSLKRLLLSNNKFVGSIPLAVGKLDQLKEMQFDVNLIPAAVEVGCFSRKVGHCEWSSNLKSLRKEYSLLTPIKETLNRYFDLFPMYRFGKGSFRNDASDSYDNVPSASELDVKQNLLNMADVRRRKLVEQPNNIAAYPFNNGNPVGNFNSYPSSTSSGSFPAVPSKNSSSSIPAGPLQPPSPNTSNPTSASVNQPADKQPPAAGNSEHTWKYIIGISSGGFLLFFAAAVLVVIRGRTAKNIGPWKTGLSGQLQKAFVTAGVPKLNSAELETACEDFSNIVQAHDTVTVYKGTLSSGVEIAVASTVVNSLNDWSKRAEIAFRKKIDSLSRVNHKNFMNLIGYCEEDDPFVRMMVFEYAPNGSLSEHLHVKELEHLDWSTRMRIIIGTAYCLQHMHGLNPPLPHGHLNSKAILLTDDYAAKIADIAFWDEFVKKSAEHEGQQLEYPLLEDEESDVYNFGLLLLEVISGKLPYSEEHGSLLNWAAEYLNDKRSISYLIDPTLKSFKNNELDIICEVIAECIQENSRKRPTMKEVATKLRDALDISPDSATPRLSPLWWAELEILSSEAA